MQTKNLELIKQKIIKTDEVLKIYLEKRNELSEQSSKYQALLKKYEEKCKELDKLKIEINKNQFNCDQYKKAIQFEHLYNELSKSYADLEVTYSQQVNKSEIKYQNVNRELQQSANKQLEQLETIKDLQETIKELKSKINKNSQKKNNSKNEEKIKNLETDNINLRECISKLEFKKEELNGKITDLMLEINLLNNSDRFVPKEIEERSTQTDFDTAEDLEVDNFFVNYFLKTVTKPTKLLSPLVSSSETSEDADFNTCSSLFGDDQIENECFPDHLPELCDEIALDNECIHDDYNYGQITDSTIIDENVKDNIVCGESPNLLPDFCDSAMISTLVSLPDISNCNKKLFSNISSDNINSPTNSCDNTTESAVNNCNENSICSEIKEHSDKDTGESDLTKVLDFNEKETENVVISKIEPNIIERSGECDITFTEDDNLGETVKTPEMNLQNSSCNETNSMEQEEEGIEEIKSVSFMSNENGPVLIKSGDEKLNQFAKTEILNTSVENEMDEAISVNFSSSESDIDDNELQCLIDEMKFVQPMLSPLSSEYGDEPEANDTFLFDHSYSNLPLEDKNVSLKNNCTETLNQGCSIQSDVVEKSVDIGVDDKIDIMSLPIIFVNELQDVTELESFIFDPEKTCIETGCNKNTLVKNSNESIEDINEIESKNTIEKNTSLIEGNDCSHEMNNLNGEHFEEKCTEKEIKQIKRKLPQKKSKVNKKRKTIKSYPEISSIITIEEQIHELFNEMLNFTSEPLITTEVANKLKEIDQNLILDEIFVILKNDCFDKLNMKYTPPAPPLTVTQQVILGLMLKLVKLKMCDLLMTFLNRAEQVILTEKQIQRFIPVTRMYVAVCKIKRDLHRVRRLCFDALYFMGDLVVPFLFCVLTSWTEVLPTQNCSADKPLVKVLVQIVNLKTCNKPGYNLLNLRNFLNVYYQYPQERWNTDEIMTELIGHFKVKATKELEYGIVILCKNMPTKWVCEQIQKQLKPLIYNSDISNETIGLINKIMSQFNTENECHIANSIKS